MIRQILMIMLLTGGLLACSSGGEDTSASAEAAASEAPAAPADTRPIEEVAGSIDWGSASATVESMRAAKDAISSGMALQEALETAAGHVGIPKQAGSGTANWLARNDAGDCVNLMIVAEEARVKTVSFDTFPAGSMGEVKCQNFAV